MYVVNMPRRSITRSSNPRVLESSNVAVDPLHSLVSMSSESESATCLTQPKRLTKAKEIRVRDSQVACGERLDNEENDEDKKNLGLCWRPVQMMLMLDGDHGNAAEPEPTGQLG